MHSCPQRPYESPARATYNGFINLSLRLRHGASIKQRNSGHDSLLRDGGWGIYLDSQLTQHLNRVLAQQWRSTVEIQGGVAHANRTDHLRYDTCQWVGKFP
ncbi:hypothetical protein D3C73_1421060 [compost metagenome]